MITGAEAMVRCLEAEGVPVLFGYPGATIAPFYDSLRASKIRHVLTRTEQGAGHAASGYARISQKPGVCVVTSGPGATNLLTAIATAYSDSIPLVAITGQVATRQLGRDVFQEVDTTGAAAPFTKYSYLVKSAADLPRVFREAFHIASTGRKGPVLIDVPVDVQRQMIEFSYPDGVSIRGYKPPHAGHPLQIRKVAEAIRAAKRPLICAGGGVFLSGAAEIVRAFAEKFRLPVVSTLMGVGALPADHPCYYGMLGMTGTTTGNIAIDRSDLLILIGARVGDRAITRPDSVEKSTTVVHIDIDTAEIGKNVGATIPLVGDAAAVVSKLSEMDLEGDRSEWLDELDVHRAKEREKMLAKQSKPGFLHPGAFVRMLSERLPENCVYVADVGQNQIWSARNFRAKNGRFLTTGGMGTMGYSIPAAIGAKAAAPERCVVAVCGDGSFQMSMNELATMRQHGFPVKIVILKNGKLGMVLGIQRSAYGGREFAVDLEGSPDFELIAAAYGIGYARVSDMEAAEDAVRRMLESPGGYLLECAVDPEEGVQ
ncbi:MAG: biosynthetic-type acetolactate synthase large subunit [Clostridiales bacterium]|nr:biosynthetic-type acetolactate synthase large subunit [Clostridiales bacterium]